jgi:hypothetical protein
MTAAERVEYDTPPTSYEAGVIAEMNGGPHWEWKGDGYWTRNGVNWCVNPQP